MNTEGDFGIRIYYFGMRIYYLTMNYQYVFGPRLKKGENKHSLTFLSQRIELIIENGLFSR